ncbi:MAG: hypothetical protein WDN69_37865 [Aliidongia sp.]
MDILHGRQQKTFCLIDPARNVTQFADDVASNVTPNAHCRFMYLINNGGYYAFPANFNNSSFDRFFEAKRCRAKCLVIDLDAVIDRKFPLFSHNSSFAQNRRSRLLFLGVSGSRARLKGLLCPTPADAVKLTRIPPMDSISVPIPAQFPL